MIKTVSPRCLTAFATLLLALGLVTSAQAQTTGPITLLDDAYATLAQCDHDYKGHRVHAMKQIDKAIHELGGRVSGHGHGREPQGTSDAQLRAAEGLLQEVSASLPKKALKHVDEAMDQLKTALAVK